MTAGLREVPTFAVNSEKRRLQITPQRGVGMRRWFLVLAMASSMVLAGCFGDGSGTVAPEETSSIWESYSRIDAQPHEVERMFTTIDLRTNESTNTTWAVFDASYGGNCCEHYLATDIDGQILNIGGEYPVFSTDRGHLWDTYVPPALPDAQCRTFVPTNPGKRDWVKGASFRRPTATSSRCRGSPTSEVTSNSTSSTPFSTTNQKGSGSGVQPNYGTVLRPFLASGGHRTHQFLHR